MLNQKFKPANLLIDIDGFTALAPDNDLSSAIDSFMDSIELSKRVPDTLCNNILIWETVVLEHNVVELLRDDIVTKSLLPWLSRDHRRFLTYELLSRRSTPDSTDSYAAFVQEMGFDKNNGQIGFLTQKASTNDNYVCDEETWFWLHVRYLSNNPQWINWAPNAVLPVLECSNAFLVPWVKAKFPAETASLYEDGAVLRLFSERLVRSFRNNPEDLIALADAIALRNAYTYDEALSSKERKANKDDAMRRIYRIMKNGRLQYLSLDFENGLFEVCDHSGRHLGAWNFTGEQKEKADPSGKHDLKSLQQ